MTPLQRHLEELRLLATGTTAHSPTLTASSGSSISTGLRAARVTMPAAPADSGHDGVQGSDETSVQPDVELVLPALPENVAVVRHVFAGVGDVLGMDSSSLGRLRLALSEACTNVVVHAYDEDKGGTLEVDAIIEDRLLNVDRPRPWHRRAPAPGLAGPGDGAAADRRSHRRGRDRRQRAARQRGADDLPAARRG